MKTVLVFGTFDNFHTGHEFFLESASALGDRLIVSVARDTHVELFKNKTPINNQNERLENIKNFHCVDDAVLSDEEIGSFEILQAIKPDLIVLGFDQNNLEQELNKKIRSENLSIKVDRIKTEYMDIALAIAEQDDKILLLHRKDKNPMWDKKWEFPGGKVDKGEKPSEAVLREFEEETGLKGENPTFIGNYTHDWHLENKIRRVHLHVFSCQVNGGEVRCENHTSYGAEWVPKEKISDYDMLAANHHILKTMYLKSDE